MSFTVKVPIRVRFLSMLAPALLLTGYCHQAGAEPGEKQLFEWRTYELKSEEKADLFDKTVADAYLPALKRAGIGPVGVFKEKDPKGEGGLKRYMLIPYDSADAVVTLREKLKKDSEFLAAAGDYLGAKKGNENVKRIDSRLFIGFDAMPKLKLPNPAPNKSERFFELRKYESLGELKGELKVQMFNVAELAIFDKVGLNGVFYGQALMASDLPQLTYMLVYDDDDAHKKAWKSFLEHPDWIELKGDATYKDTVSKIENVFLVAMEYSQVQ